MCIWHVISIVRIRSIVFVYIYTVYIYTWCISSDTYIENTSLFIYIIYIIICIQNSKQNYDILYICVPSCNLRKITQRSPFFRPAAGVSASNQCAVATSCQDLRCYNPAKPGKNVRKPGEKHGKNMTIQKGIIRQWIWLIFWPSDRDWTDWTNFHENGI